MKNRGDRQRQQLHQEALAFVVPAWDKWADDVRAVLSEVADPVERIVRVVADTPELEWLPRLLIPDLWPEKPPPFVPYNSARASHQSQPHLQHYWDHDAVQAWFLGAVKTPPAGQPSRRKKRSLLGGVKWEDETVPGWNFPKGSTAADRVGESDTGMPLVRDICILIDGRRTMGGGWTEHGAGFNADALRRMAELSKLPSLPPRPAQNYYRRGSSDRVWP